VTPEEVNQSHDAQVPSSVPTHLPSPESNGLSPAPVTPDKDIFGRVPTRTVDWSHRRGEPRWFALWWTVFVLASSMIALASAGGPLRGSFESYQPALRVLLLVLGAGVALLWPATRLSQVPPEGGLAGAAKAMVQDFIVVQVPVQAVLLPLVVLARWPTGVVLALSAHALAWGLLVGALLAVGISRLRAERTAAGDRPWVWMLVFFTIVLAAPLAEIIILGAGATGEALAQPSMIEWWWLGSPATAGLEITRPRPWAGAAASITPSHIIVAAIVGGVGLCVWGAIGLAVVARKVRA
jgi:hypothetical protein